MVDVHVHVRQPRDQELATAVDDARRGRRSEVRGRRHSDDPLPFDEHRIAGQAVDADGTLFTVELVGRTTRIRSLDLTTGQARIAGVVEGWISRETPNLAIGTDRGSVLMARFTGLAADLMVVETRDD